MNRPSSHCNSRMNDCFYACEYYYKHAMYTLLNKNSFAFVKTINLNLFLLQFIITKLHYEYNLLVHKNLLYQYFIVCMHAFVHEVSNSNYFLILLG
jgi:hypothetical protein